MRLALALALGPLPALAFDGADCLMDRACFDQSCEATEIPMTLQPEGKGWELAWQQGVIRLTGSVTDPAGTIALYQPLTGDEAGMLTIYPSGESVLTQHRLVEGRVQVATFYGNCGGTGG